MEALPLAFSSGWASGVNAYLVVLVLGVTDRVGDVAEVPDVLGRWDVLTVAGLLYAMEFVADKIPYVDSTWDSISTFIRPAVAAGIAAVIAGDLPTLEQLAYVLLGGGTALASHSVKAGSRLAINASPEPFTNVGASVGEDITVVEMTVTGDSRIIGRTLPTSGIAGSLTSITWISPDDDAPSFGPSRRLDLELELGTVVGMPSVMGRPVTLEQYEAFPARFTAERTLAVDGRSLTAQALVLAIGNQAPEPMAMAMASS